MWILCTWTFPRHSTRSTTRLYSKNCHFVVLVDAFLTHRIQYVLVNGFRSQPTDVKSGVPQGSVLGPLLFLILIGDIDAELGTSFLSSFTDDTRVSKGIGSIQDSNLLQADLAKIYQWAERNNQWFNVKKARTPQILT